MNAQEIDNYRKAGEIAKQLIVYAKEIIKPNMPLLEIAEKIEHKTIQLGAKPAFPVNLSINDITAHYTPSHDDKTEASGLLKVDIGIHVNGCIADTAFSIDLENSKENKELIQASEQALESALREAKNSTEVWKLGEKIQNAITKKGFSPVINLSGHELEKYKIHAGTTIPNYNNNNKNKLEKGAYAIEPFATTGQGLVYEGKPSSIYELKDKKPIRDAFARQLLSFIEKEYQTLPFCSRWIVKKFNTRALLSLSLLEKSNILYQYPQLIEKSHQKVSQAEHTILITDKEEVTTR